MSDVIVNVNVPFSATLMSFTLRLAVSSLVIVPLPWLSPMTMRVASVAPLNFASDRFTTNVSSLSTRESLLTVTVTVVLVVPAAMVAVWPLICV